MIADENRKFDQEMLAALTRLGFEIEDGGVSAYAGCSVLIGDDMGFRIQMAAPETRRLISHRVTRDQILVSRKSGRSRRRGPYAMTHHSSPTCIVKFADGEITRMTTWSANGKPDLRRGIRLAWAAHESRKQLARLRKRKQLGDVKPPEKCGPPAITALHFEFVDGRNTTTTKFTADQIAEATNDAR